MEDSSDLDNSVRRRVANFYIGSTVVKLLDLDIPAIGKCRNCALLFANGFIVKQTDMHSACGLVAEEDARRDRHYFKDLELVGSYLGLEFDILA